MLFNSIEFAFFLPLVFAVYWTIGRARIREQNFFLLLASYFFYGWWDYRFLALIAFSSVVDFTLGQLIHTEKSERKRKMFLWMSLLTNLGLLGFFKYYDFFLDNFVTAFSFFGYQMDPQRLAIILPIGISFYTFQTLSYTIDVYRKQLAPVKDFIAFSAFVSFFPQLVAGPIERAHNLLPQFFKEREFSFENGRDGLRQILWGLFKKIVIADTCAIYANEIFDNYQVQSPAMLVLGAVYFAFQIYGDFSGYSDIAIGTAKLFGFKLMKNFNFPYFSRDIAEFWRRWHISLSTWFRDYLYIPLGGSRGGKYAGFRNVVIIFVVSGFWHGANWTFIFWGALNAAFYIPLLLFKQNRKHLDDAGRNRVLPSFREFFQIVTTFSLTVFAWIFFRAEDLSHAFGYIARFFEFTGAIFWFKFKYLQLVGVLVIWEWLMRDKDHGLAFENTPRYIRWLLYLVLIWMVLYYFGEEQEFIYFQF